MSPSKRLLDITREHVFARMIRSYVLIEISTLLGSMSAIGTFELRLLAALVPRVSDQCGAMLVTLAASLATIRKLDPLRHPKAGQVLDQRYHRVVAIPLKVLRHSHTRDGYVCKSHEEENERSLVGGYKTDRVLRILGDAFFFFFFIYTCVKTRNSNYES